MLSFNDLVAVAAPASYMSKSNLKSAEFNASEKETAFRKLAEKIAPNLKNGKEFAMADLLNRYKGLLQDKGVTVENYIVGQRFINQTR